MMMAEMIKGQNIRHRHGIQHASKPKNTGSSRVGGIAVRPQVAGVGDKDLVYDVVSAPTSREIMQGMAYCLMSLPIRSVPKN